MNQITHGLINDIATKVSRAPKSQPVKKVVQPQTVATSGPVFITPVTVASGDVSSGGWVTYNAAGEIPAGAKAVILDAAITTSGGANMEMLIRPGNLGYSLRLCAGLDPAVASGNGTFPIYSQNSVRCFDYQMTDGDLAASWDLRIIGYVL